MTARGAQGADAPRAVSGSIHRMVLPRYRLSFPQLLLLGAGRTRCLSKRISDAGLPREERFS